MMLTRCLGILFTLLIFSTFCFILSLSFIELSGKDEIEALESYERDLKIPKRINLKRLHERVKKVQDIEMSKLKNSKTCRFQCRPAVELHESGSEMGYGEKAPSVRIMKTHCLKCLKSKGYLKNRRKRRKKRDLNSKEKFVPTSSLQIQSSNEPQDFVHLFKRKPYHLAFGGWISSILDAAEEIIRQNWMPIRHEVAFRTSRNILAEDVDNSQKWPAGLETVTKQSIVIREQDEDYENNYDDESAKGDLIPDLDKVEKKTQDTISYFLIGSFAFFAVLCMCVFPVVSFVRMCFQNFRENANICLDVCSCRDPKYRLVKDLSNKCGIPIAPYKEYKRLMKEYAAKEALKEKKDKAEEENA